jgi:hypothetical protein
MTVDETVKILGKLRGATLPLDNITETKCKCKSDNEANKSYKVMGLNEKINILHKLLGGVYAATVCLIFRWYLNFKSNFPFIL